MRTFSIQNGEKKLSTWGWRLCFGPTHMLDGFVYFVSLGFVHTSFAINIAVRLAKSRY